MAVTEQTKKALLHLALLINMVSIGTLMMVMPLGADLVRDIGLPAEHVGYLSGGATFASALLGFVLAPFLDRFDRKPGLVGFLALRSLLVFCCGFATSTEQLLFCFVLAGCVSGPISGLTQAAVIDVTELRERGRAMAYVASGYSLAAIVVVPVALQLSQWFSWQMTFFCFGAFGGVLALLVGVLLPSLKGHLVSGAVAPVSLFVLLRSNAFSTAMLLVALSMFGHFLLVPNLSAYFQFNLSFPRDQIGLLYLFGGIASIGAMKGAGRLLDRGWQLQTIWGLSLTVALVVACGFLAPGLWPIYLVFVLFMAASSARGVVAAAISSRVPRPEQRAAFMSYQGTVANLAAGAASVTASWVLVTDADNRLQGMESLALVTIVCALLMPLLVQRLLRLLRPAQPPAEPSGAAS